MQYRNGYRRYFFDHFLAIFDTNTFAQGAPLNSMQPTVFGASGSNVTKRFHATCREAGVFKWTQFLGKARPLKFGRPKFGAISDNFRL